jgi:type IV pilus assembly protein PilA
MRKRKEGFTLVELLIVMAVIAALMGALVPVALNAIKHANATRVAENLRSIQSAVQNYAYSEHKVPALSTLISGNYLTGHITESDYGLYWGTGSSATEITSDTDISGATVTVAIVYKGSAADGDAIHNAWQEATTTSVPGSGTAMVTTVIARYW